VTGLAIKEYWGVDDNSVVFVADPTFGDILNFNVGAGVDLEVPKVRDEHCANVLIGLFEYGAGGTLILRC
jgi:hypothetical protein